MGSIDRHKCKRKGRSVELKITKERRESAVKVKKREKRRYDCGGEYHYVTFVILWNVVFLLHFHVNAHIQCISLR